jgi:hypothetical protein
MRIVNITYTQKLSHGKMLESCRCCIAETIGAIVGSIVGAKENRTIDGAGVGPSGKESAIDLPVRRRDGTGVSIALWNIERPVPPSRICKTGARRGIHNCVPFLPCGKIVENLSPNLK